MVLSHLELGLSSKKEGEDVMEGQELIMIAEDIPPPVQPLPSTGKKIALKKRKRNSEEDDGKADLPIPQKKVAVGIIPPRKKRGADLIPGRRKLEPKLEGNIKATKKQRIESIARKGSKPKQTGKKVAPPAPAPLPNPPPVTTSKKLPVLKMDSPSSPDSVEDLLGDSEEDEKKMEEIKKGKEAPLKKKIQLSPKEKTKLLRKSTARKSARSKT